MAGIYLHIPFCKQACYYCDFHFSTNQRNKSELIDAIASELTLQQPYLQGEKIKTIYFGGGTPSLLTSDELSLLLETIKKNYAVDEHAEVTLEANPDDLSLAKLKELRVAGINRLSIGIQSFDDKVLQFLNRAHNQASAQACVMEARIAGFKNISIDLIYAIPGQSDAAWIHNIEQVLQLAPEHISSYSLTIEPKTAFGKWSAAGTLKVVDDEVAAAQLELLVAHLEPAGYEQYEVSNFASPQFQSQHNSSYWKEEKYLGVGPSAHSYNGSSRQYNISNNQEYLRAIHEERVPFTREVLTPEDKINDYLLTTLRTAWGTDLQKLKDHFNYDLIAQHMQYVENLVNQKFARVENNKLILTKAGKLLADKVASDLFIVK